MQSHALHAMSQCHVTMSCENILCESHACACGRALHMTKEELADQTLKADFLTLRLGDLWWSIGAKSAW